MIVDFCKKLENAEAKVEFVIAIFCDIRSFSSFSKTVESPDTSTFLKHFYLKLLRNYFQEAVFAKPTGDGLLIIYRHTEKNLNEISELILSRCFKAVKDFPKMFQDIPIVNYAPPVAIGFGIARGSASFLTVENEILDYSGKLLNLAARLNDLARPTGIVIDGNYQLSVIPKNFRKLFAKQKAFIRGIAEEEPIEIFYSKEIVISPTALSRIKEPKRQFVEMVLKVEEVSQFNLRYFVNLPVPALSKEHIKADFAWPNPKVKGHESWLSCENFGYQEAARGSSVSFDIAQAKKIIEDYQLNKNSKFYFRVDYLPKHAA